MNERKNMDAEIENRIEKLEELTVATRKAGRSRVVWGVTVITLAISVLFNVATVISHYERQSNRSKENSFWMLCHSGTTAAQRKAAFLHLLQENNTEWASARLAELDLNGADFEQVNLHKARLDRVKLRGASLIGARLVQCSMQLIDLTDATLTDADMKGVDLLQGIANRIDLQNAIITRGRLEQSNLLNANLSWANLEEANLLMSDLSESSLFGANLRGAYLESTNLSRTILDEVNFEDANLVDTNFSDSNWWRARGFHTKELERLIEQFPPGDSAPQQLKDDFAQWLDDYNSDSNKDTPSD